MKRCRNCNAWIPDGANYCSDCGAAQYGDEIYVEKKEEEQPSEIVRDDSPQSNRMPIPMLLGIIGIVASFVVSGIAGLVLGLISYNLDREGKYRKFAVWAIVLGAVMTVADIVLAVLYSIYFADRVEEFIRNGGLLSLL